jgi:hypothetical protein
MIVWPELDIAAGDTAFQRDHQSSAQDSGRPNSLQRTRSDTMYSMPRASVIIGQSKEERKLYEAHPYPVATHRGYSTLLCCCHMQLELPHSSRATKMGVLAKTAWY